MRSLLFVSGNCARKLEQGLRSGADALIVDLQDPVALTAKARARATAWSFLRDIETEAARPVVFVRINDLASGLADADLAGLAGARIDGIMLPRTVGGVDLQRLAAKLAVWEAETGVADGATRIVAAATDTARGLLVVGTLPDASARLCAVAWDAERLSRDLGAETYRDPDGRLAAPHRHARMMTLVTAAAAGVEAIDTVYTEDRDLAHLALECRAAARDGFAAKIAVHPAQIPVINEALPLTVHDGRPAGTVRGRGASGPR